MECFAHHFTPIARVVDERSALAPLQVEGGAEPLHRLDCTVVMMVLSENTADQLKVVVCLQIEACVRALHRLVEPELAFALPRRDHLRCRECSVCRDGRVSEASDVGAFNRESIRPVLSGEVISADLQSGESGERNLFQSRRQMERVLTGLELKVEPKYGFPADGTSGVFGPRRVEKPSESWQMLNREDHGIQLKVKRAPGLILDGRAGHASAGEQAAGFRQVHSALPLVVQDRDHLHWYERACLLGEFV